MTTAKRLEFPRILSLGAATLLLAAGLSAQSRYLGELDGNHSVTRVYSRSGSCTIATRLTPVRQITTFEPGTFEISPPSGFSCQPHRFRDGSAVVNHPDVPVLVELSNPTAAPTVVNLSEPSNVTARITLMGRAEFRSGGDKHAVRIGVEVGLDPGARIARDQLTCSRQDDFVTDKKASRQINADAACSVSVMDVVGGSVTMADVGGVMTVTEFNAEVESEFYIVMDHGSANDGNSIRRGARLTYTVKSRYKFQRVNDTIEISSFAPPLDEPLAAEDVEERFQASINYSLQNAAMGQVVLKLFGRSGLTIEELITPLFQDVSKGSGTADFAVTPFVVPKEGEVVMVAELVGPDGKVLETTPEIVWAIGLVDLTMDHIEVVQVIQTADNAIPLIANKTTVIRPFTKIAAGPDQMLGVEVDVHAFRGGAEIAGSPIRRRSVSGYITSKEPSRDFVFHAHNLTLPAHWTEEGELTLRVLVNPKRTIPEADFSNNEMEATVRFVKGTPFIIRYLPVCIEIPGLKELCPSRRVASVAGLVPKLFPIAERDFTYRGLNIPDAKFDDFLNTGEQQARFTSWLNRTYQLAVSQFGRFDQLIAWVPRGFGGRTLLGWSDPIWNGGQGRVTLGFDDSEGRNVSDLPSAIASTRVTLAHEMSHNLGLRHPNTRDSCGSRDRNTDWPYGSHWINEYGYEPGSRLKRPQTHHDLMSYCDESKMWISDFHYLKLIAGMLQPQPLTAGPEEADLEDEKGKEASPVSQQGPVTVLMVSGAVDRDLNTGRIEEVYQFASGAPLVPTNPAGNTCLRFSGDAGAISDHCFELTFTTSESGESFDEDSFTVVTPLDTETTRIALLFNGQELASRAASAAPPAVQITSPNAGDTWDAAADGTVTWTASDTDGDSLLYSLLYSSDNGTTWLPIVIDLTEPTYTFSPALIQGGDEVHFRVVASDGFHSSEAQAGPITVNQRPEISPEQDPVDIGQAVLGDQVSGEVVLQNPGTGPLAVASAATDQPEFQVVFPQGPFTIRAGADFSVEVNYEPSAEQSQSAMLLVTSNATDQPQLAVRLNGEGVDGQSPILRLDSTVVDFGAVEIGETRNASLVARNASHVDLAVSWSIQGGGFGPGAPATAATVPAGEEFSVPLVFTGAEAGDAMGRLTLTSDDPDRPTTEVTLLALTLPPPGTVTTPGGPRVNAGGVVDAASFQAVVARGGIGSLFGVNLADGVQIAGDVPLPLALGGAAVQVDGHNAPLFFVSPAQINFQVPFEVRANATVEVLVIRNEVESPPVSVPVADYAPGVFINPNTGEPIIQRHPDFALITANNPAQPGDVLIVFVTGIGDVSNPPPSGAPALGSPLATANLTPTVTVGGAQAQVFFAGLAPFFVGLGQVNIQLPNDFTQSAALRTGAAQGATLPLVIAFGESRSQAVNLPIAGVTAQPGRIDVGPVGLDFGEVNAGQSGDGTLTVRNVGAGSLTVNSINTDNARFAVVSPSTPFSVSPGGQRMITLRFQPTVVGRVDASALIGSDDPLNPTVTIPLLGHGVGGAAAGSLSVSTTSLAFGSVNLGQSADLSLTLSNTGGADLTVNAITSSDPQFSTVFTGSPSGAPFTLDAGAELTFAVRFQPSSAGMHNATLSLGSSDAATPIVNISLSGESAAGGSPGITLNTNTVTYGSVSVGRTNELTLIVTNSGGGLLTVESITSSDPQFRAPAPETPFSVPVGGQQNVKVHFTPSSLGSHSGTLTFASNDPAQPTVAAAVSGSGVEGAHIQFSDSFDRPDANCSPAPADNAFGGGGRHGYLPIFTTRGRPTGARLASDALENPGTDYAGVQFSDDEQPCLGGTGEDIGQDANIRVDLLVPGDNDGNITQAGPYFRTRSATPGSSIIGGMSAGYWVQLHSTGQIKIKLLNPEDTVAATRVPASFDNTVMHTLEVSMRRARLWVALDGVLQVFDQDDARLTSVPIPAVWDRLPAVGVNEGAAGIAFGAEDNPDQIGGQRADNLVVTDYESLNELPVQE